MKRICKKCGKEKEIEEFTKHKKCRYGRGFTCKMCTNKQCTPLKRTPKYKARRKIYEQTPERKKAVMLRMQTPKYKAQQKIYGQTSKSKEHEKKRALSFKRKNQRKQHTYLIINNLDDQYIMRTLCCHTGMKIKDITPEMIELKREFITFYRLKKELTNGINSR